MLQNFILAVSVLLTCLICALMFGCIASSSEIKERHGRYHKIVKSLIRKLERL